MDAISVLMACLASFNAFFPSFPLVISGKIGLLRCRHTKRLRAAQQNTTQPETKQKRTGEIHLLNHKNIASNHSAFM